MRYAALLPYAVYVLPCVAAAMLAALPERW